MKRCPTCQRTFIDETQKFCPSDGTPLMSETAPAFDPEATVMSSASQIREEAPSQAPPAPPQPPAASAPSTPPTPYYNPDAGAGAQPAPNIHQSAPPPGGSPSPAWPPAPPQQQPYYPQPGAPGAQPTPQWQGGPQPQQPGWTPGQPPQAQWGAGGYYPQQPGQYAQFGAPPAAGGKSTVALAAMICGIVAFVTYAAALVIIGTRMTDLYDLLWALRWLWMGTGIAGLVLGIIGLISSKTGSSKAKAGIGLALGVLTLIFYFTNFYRLVV